MSTKQILIAAKAKIAAPDKWTQGELARNINGKDVHYSNPKAVCFCSVGAIVAAAPSSSDGGVAAVRLLEEVVGKPIAGWNDNPHRTHADVLAAFDRAIALANNRYAINAIGRVDAIEYSLSVNEKGYLL